MSSPQLTAKWEYKLQLIEQGQFSSEQFHNETREFVKQVLAEILAGKKENCFQSEAESSLGECPKCGNTLKVKEGKFGKFIGCNGYSADGSGCDYHVNTLEKPIGNCPRCGKALVVKKGKAGFFLSCSAYNSGCSFSGSGKKTKEGWKLIQLKGMCRSCGKPLLEKKSRKGTPFIACSSGSRICPVIFSSFTGVVQECPEPGCNGWIALQTSKGGAFFIGCSNRECSSYSSRKWIKKGEDPLSIVKEMKKSKTLIT